MNNIEEPGQELALERQLCLGRWLEQLLRKGLSTSRLFKMERVPIGLKEKLLKSLNP